MTATAVLVVVASAAASADVVVTVMSVEVTPAAAAELVGESAAPGRMPETSEPAPAPKSPRAPPTPPRRSRRTYIMRCGEVKGSKNEVKMRSKKKGIREEKNTKIRKRKKIKRSV